MVYFVVAYLGILRERSGPTFQVPRCHGVVARDCIAGGTVGHCWMPRAVYWGKLGVHLWTSIAISHLFIMLECIKCTFTGMYVDVSFARNVDFVHSLLLDSWLLVLIILTSNGIDMRKLCNWVSQGFTSLSCKSVGYYVHIWKVWCGRALLAHLKRKWQF